MCKKIEIMNWMTAKLGLSGNELVLFAILWRESNQGKQKVTGDYSALSGAMNTTIPTMYNCIRKLVERGYVIQPEKGLYEISPNLNLT